MSAVLAFMGITGGLGILSAYATIQAQKAQLAYAKKVKAAQDKYALEDLRKAGHDALIAKETLYEQVTRQKADIGSQAANAISAAVVQQAAMGVTGNTAKRITNSVYGKVGDMETDLDISARAEVDRIGEQVQALETRVERQLESGQVVDFSSSFATSLQIATGALQGAQAGVSLYTGYKNLSTGMSRYSPGSASQGEVTGILDANYGEGRIA